MSYASPALNRLPDAVKSRGVFPGDAGRRFGRQLPDCAGLVEGQGVGRVISQPLLEFPLLGRR